MAYASTGAIIGYAATAVAAGASVYSAADQKSSAGKARRFQRQAQSQALGQILSATRAEARAQEELNKEIPDPTAILESELRRSQKPVNIDPTAPGSTSTLGGL